MKESELNRILGFVLREDEKFYLSHGGIFWLPLRKLILWIENCKGDKFFVGKPEILRGKMYRQV